MLVFLEWPVLAVKPGATPESAPLCEREPHRILRLFPSQESSLERFHSAHVNPEEKVKTYKMTTWNLHI